MLYVINVVDKGVGAPGGDVDVNPVVLASVSASIVVDGMQCVLKLTRVPSMSKNRALIISWSTKLM